MTAAKNPWADLHEHYQKQEWVDKPSIFAEQVIGLFPSRGDLLELGSGLGQDSRYFAQAGYSVVSTDIEQALVDLDESKMTPDLIGRLQYQQLDLRDVFPIAENSFDIVYAHLSLHYFDTATTKQVFTEIERVLKPHGVLAFLVNSTRDPEFGTGTEIESDFYQIDHLPKRYFDLDSTAAFTKNFEVILLDDKGETYKDRAKGVHNLIRFVGKKITY